ncbi:phenylalanine--tRNA ligase subunit beta [Helicobacter mustelae]|uniref:Phenylalanine--tRNA ligase beta subunit n=1 Tax=Helicobacter mustelae (strain ATCC 43772 / CCUG 25715 / CIP 103759 / LMG 18044 / NCTC 12198 / R85-136P) TaxID=679897 RepID=D3UFP8_HELM1|nr:phenylalanine--tRNA ligase subunit beta [Helicobacter mustelae]CBG39319.1 phenylalanyl-tRNA synthetase beta chain [Helicobacter mustelae 12198]SQH70831.1 phenylalanyl-tRNA synthetase subunit beta [Helicobacter mustelae]
MIVATHLLEEFIDISHLDIQEICKVLDNIGLEVESLTRVQMPRNVVVGKVLEKNPHPDADKLSVCQVDVGKECLQIVCGAKNVDTDQFVAVALKGARLEFDGRVLEIGESKLRGVNSYGMLCSSTELGLGKINEGIMLLDHSIGELDLGRELCDYESFQGYNLEISLTPNRGDCLCVLGIARELKAYFGLKLKKSREYMSTNQIGVGRKFQVAMENKISASLFYKVVDFESKTLPLKLGLALANAGILKKGILENYLAYITYMTGVILNAYEADALRKDQNQANEILWLHVREDEKGFETIYAEERLSNIGIGNVIHQDIDHAKTIVFEASYIPPTKISKLLHTYKDFPHDKELVYKTTRGSNPDLHMGMNYLCLLLGAHNDCFIYNGMQEVKQDAAPNIIRTQFSNISSIIGAEIDGEIMSEILKRLDFYLEVKANDDSFSIVVPGYRHDVFTEQDLAEEILRIYGVDKIPAVPHKMSEISKITPVCTTYKNQRALISRALANGFLECIHYLFYQKERLHALGFPTLREEKELLNPITSELNTLRTSLLPALLDSVARNQNYGYRNIKLCEIGSVYDRERTESTKIAFVVSGCLEGEIFPHPKGVKWDFYTFARVISQIMGEFTLQKSSQALPHVFHPYQSAEVLRDGKKLGIIAKLHPSIAKELEIQNAFICELDVDAFLLEHPLFSPFSKLPTSQRDLTVLIDRDIAFGNIRDVLMSARILHLKNLYPMDIFSENETQIALSIRVEIVPLENNLREEDIQAIMQKILEILEENFGAKLK